MATISINAVLGENGIIRQAEKTKLIQSHASVSEAISLAYADYQFEQITGITAKVEETKLASVESTPIKLAEANDETFLEYLIRKGYADANGVINVENLLGSSTGVGNGTGSSDVYKVEETEDGKYELNYYGEDGVKNDLWEVTTGTDWEEILKDANTNPDKYKHPEQEESIDIGIGADGNPVDMDNWLVTYDEDIGGYILGEAFYGYGKWYNPGYIGEYTDDGQIIGKVPQYVMPDGETEFVPVRHVSFTNCESLEIAPILPETVTSMEYTFSGCTNLKEVPQLPKNITGLQNTFAYCESLENAPEIPSSVIDMTHTFYACDSLKTSPIIPKGVEIMDNTFGGSGLVSMPEIPNTVTNMFSTFWGCSDLVNITELPDSVENLTGTFMSCASLKVAPVIPDNGKITNLNQTFANCESLESTPKIPESVTVLFETFFECTELKFVQNIPNSVIRMVDTFYGCENLAGTIEINANVTYFDRCFEKASTALTGDNKLYITGTSPVLDDIIATKSETSKIERLPSTESE